MHTDDTFALSPTNLSKAGTLNVPIPASINPAIKALKDILHPLRKTGAGYKVPEINHVVRARLELMVAFLRLYKAAGYTGWERHLETMAMSAGKGTWLARMICQ